MAKVTTEVKPPEWANVKIPNIMSKDYLEYLSFIPPDIHVIDKAWKDDITRERGIGIIQDMLQDARVSQSSDLKKSAVINVGYKITINTKIIKDEDMQAEVKSFVEFMFEEIKGSKFEFFKNILSAFDYGYSFNILTLKMVDRGLFKGKWVVDYATPIPPSLYRIRFDDDGAISHLEAATSLGLMAKTNKQNDEKKIIQMDQLIYMKLGTNFNSPYGKSQITKVFESWWNKKILRRMRNSAFDRFGAPFLVGKVSPNSTEKKRQELLKILRTISIESVAVMGTDEAIEAVQTGGLAGVDAFQSALAYEDKEIVSGIAGSSLNVMEGGSQGSYAQARVHQDNFLYSVQEIIQVLEDVINEQFVRRIVGYNYGAEIADGVSIIWNAASDPQIDSFAARFTQVGAQVVDLNDPREKQWIRKELDYPDVMKPMVPDKDGNMLDPNTKEVLIGAVQAQSLGLSAPPADPSQDPNAQQQDPNAQAQAQPQEDPTAGYDYDSGSADSAWWNDVAQQTYAPKGRSYSAPDRRLRKTGRRLVKTRTSTSQRV